MVYFFYPITKDLYSLLNYITEAKMDRNKKLYLKPIKILLQSFHHNHLNLSVSGVSKLSLQQLLQRLHQPAKPSIVMSSS